MAEPVLACSRFSLIASVQSAKNLSVVHQRLESLWPKMAILYRVLLLEEMVVEALLPSKRRLVD